MRSWLVALCFVVVSCGGSSWDQAVDQANKDDKPLVIEFHAVWCGPCHWFEDKVLADADVKETLDGFSFQRFDFDSTAGKHHARRLGVSSVPTLVAVGRDGKPVGLVTGALSKPRFLEFLQWVREKHQSSSPSLATLGCLSTRK